MPDTTPTPLTDEERAVYEGPDLASTLLVRLGMVEPHQIEKQTRKKRRRLRTPKDVIRAISDAADADLPVLLDVVGPVTYRSPLG